MSLPVLLQNLLFEHKLDIAVAITLLISLAIITNIVQQVLFKNPNEPPVVFHWLPVVGSTVTYGIDPFKFFFDCQAKVRSSNGFFMPLLSTRPDCGDTDLRNKSMAMSTRSSSLAEKSPSTLDRKGISSS